jgi:hypothetical protein
MLTHLVILSGEKEKHANTKENPREKPREK